VPSSKPDLRRRLGPQNTILALGGRGTGGLLGFALRRPGAIAGLYEKGFVEISGVTPQAIEAATSMPVMHPESD